MFQFTITAKNNRARTGIFSTPHGDLLTPVFAPVGTQATVKTLTPEHLKDINASLVLSNTYHLYLRPGDELVRDMGGLHKFMQWHPHAHRLRRLSSFLACANPQDRRRRRDLQESHRRFDAPLHARKSDCDPGEPRRGHHHGLRRMFRPQRQSLQQIAMERTHRWAERSLQAQTRLDQALFGIVQGGVQADLRADSARFIASLDTPGIAIGGLSVGETKQEMHDTLDIVTPLLPENKPRYLMGVGTPEDLINGVARGIDIFDCVLPTRLARHHSAFAPEGRLNLMNATFARDERPIDETCDCYACKTFHAGVYPPSHCGEGIAGRHTVVHS
jgi:queuine tRNA-ribosyltransferase